MSLASTPRDSAFSIGSRELVAILALSQALQALAMDAMLPGLGEIASDLAVSDPNRRQLVVGMFLLGMGCGSLFPGTLSDRFGRKPVLLFTVLSYAVLSFACAMATDFAVLVVLRLLQGMLTSGQTVLGPAIIRDRFEGDRMAKLQSLIAFIFIIVPVVAPSIGQLVLLVASWRELFLIMGLFALAIAAWIALRLPESLNPQHRQPIAAAAIVQNFRDILTTRPSVGYLLAVAAITTGLWGYLQSCQQLVAEHFGAGRMFPLVFGSMALGMGVASLTNAGIVERFGARRVAHSALLVNAVAACLHLWVSLRGSETLWQFVALMMVSLICGAFISANCASIALQPFARIAGAASSTQIFLRTLLGSLASAVIGQAYDNSARPLSIGLVFAAAAALSAVLYSERWRLFQAPIGASRR